MIIGTFKNPIQIQGSKFFVRTKSIGYVLSLHPNEIYLNVIYFTENFDVGDPKSFAEQSERSMQARL